MLREAILNLSSVVTKHLTAYQHLTSNGVLTKEHQKSLDELPAKAAKEIGDAVADAAVAWQQEKNVDFARLVVLECIKAISHSPAALVKEADVFAKLVNDRADAILQDVNRRIQTPPQV